ncbi:uncharacterized protein LOC142821547 [Pelodiscus sinensis]|uniref:uncharacterized protein LOC142821547 n=1 Tax=Pelodiscus sinensis TaxID=13735 RepID=UPI003F6BE0D6
MGWSDPPLLTMGTVCGQGALQAGAALCVGAADQRSPSLGTSLCPVLAPPSDPTPDPFPRALPPARPEARAGLPPLSLAALRSPGPSTALGVTNAQALLSGVRRLFPRAAPSPLCPGRGVEAAAGEGVSLWGLKLEPASSAPHPTEPSCSGPGPGGGAARAGGRRLQPLHTNEKLMKQVPLPRLRRCSDSSAQSQGPGQRQLPGAQACPSHNRAAGEGEKWPQPPPGLSSAPHALILSPATVTLDPDTAHPHLVLSGDRKRVRWADTRQPLPDNPERFDTRPCVLGREGFTSGRHCWEVEVGDGRHWAVGVARESVSRKGGISLSPEGGIWAVLCWGVQFWALTTPVTCLPLSPPRRIRVCLDCDRGQVTFIDAGAEAPIFTFPPGSLPGERIRPWLRVWPGSPLSLCPLKSASLTSHSPVSVTSQDFPHPAPGPSSLMP